MPDVSLTLSTEVVEVTLDPGPSILCEVSPGASVGPLPSRAGWLATNSGALPLGGLRLLVQHGGALEYADATNADHLGLPIGFASRVMQAGESLVLITEGDWTDPSWGWTPGATLYLGTNGLIAEAEPVGAAFSQVVGSAIDATHILVHLLPPIRKA